MKYKTHLLHPRRDVYRYINSFLDCTRHCNLSSTSILSWEKTIKFAEGIDYDLH